MSTILVVEDDKDLQFLYGNVLKHQGNTVVAAESITDAIIRLTNEDFDAIILDMNMPDAPGLKVAEFARGDVRLKKIPIIVASANENYRAQALELGVRYYLIKPVPLQQLLQIVQDVLHS
jgi:CheY-like chemotaxis protein